MAGIYIHIPFCKQACHYCDFHFSTSIQYKGDLLSALVKEIKLQKDYLSNELAFPVVDETNLKGKYDIKTVVEMRTQEEIFISISALGLKIEKQERKMRMLVLY